jgi:adenylate kinase family enzyme
MGLTGIIVLEGANATGKSTLAKELERKHGAIVMHQTYRFRNNIFNFHTAVLRRAIKLAKTQLVVLDRLWMSEEVYAHVYRGGTPWPHQGRMVDRVLQQASAVTVVCISMDDMVLRDRFLKTRAYRQDAGVAKNLEVNIRFRSLFERISIPNRKTYFDDLVDAHDLRSDIIPYEIGEDTALTIEKVLHQIKDRQNKQLKGALGNPNFIGNLYQAEYLFVGDVTNPKYKWSWPFYDYCGCSLWMAEQLHHDLFDETVAVWTNAHGEPKTLSQLAGRGLKTIALGVNAGLELKRIGIPFQQEYRSSMFHIRSGEDAS